MRVIRLESQNILTAGQKICLHMTGVYCGGFEWQTKSRLDDNQNARAKAVDDSFLNFISCNDR